MTTHHINAIDHLKKGILAPATLVEENLLAAVRALETRDPRLTWSIIEGGDEVDEMDRLMLERFQATIREVRRAWTATSRTCWWPATGPTCMDGPGPVQRRERSDPPGWNL
jgi:hypothetical protein